MAVPHHTGCKNHVSVATGLCFCPTTGVFYSQPRCVLTKAMYELDDTDRRLKIFASHVKFCRQKFPQAYSYGFMMLEGDGVMAGMTGDCQDMQEFLDQKKGGVEQCQ